MTTQELLPRFSGVRAAGEGRWSARCPAHDDQRASLSISAGEGGKTLLHCHAGCPTADVLAIIGLTPRDLFANANGSNGNGHARPARREVAQYDYRDEQGNLLYQVVRFDPKDFRQRRPTPGGGWTWKLGDTRRVLFRLSELLAADPAATVFVVEGEKDVDRLHALGLAATCNVGGAGKWRAEYNDCLRGRPVVILPDNDAPGRAHAAQVAAALHGVAASVKVLELPNLPDKGDVSDWIDHGGNAEELARLADAAAEWEPATAAAQENKIIIIGTDEARVVDEAIDALKNCDNIYQRGGSLVHIIDGGETPPGISRPKGTPQIATMKLARLRELLASAAEWQNNKTERVHPPDWAVKALDARGQWQNIRPLTAVVESPVLRTDGTVLQSPGYDSETGIYYRPSCDFPPIAERPSNADVVRSVNAMAATVEDFPFASPAHRAGWIASVLSLLARFAFDGPAPLNTIDSNVRGAGKSKLVDTASIIATGRPAPRMTLPRDDDELRKRITALALTGERLVLLDNIVGNFGSPTLEAALTATTWTDRRLGQTEMLCGLPLYSLWYVTGNNLAIIGDIVRRIVHIRLESPLENPEERGDFHHPDLLGWVGQERPRLVAAALTILTGYCAAGRPDMGLSPWGSFEGWSALIRNAVVWTGLPDPGETRIELTAQADRDKLALARLIDGWARMDTFGGGMTVAAMLAEIAEHPADHESLRSALLELAPPRDGKTFNNRSISAKMHHLRRRIVGGRFLDGRETNKGTIWTVHKTDSGSSGSSGSR
jgi:5S rRNA maturation endonuclease (ribonuclease M5)